MFTQLIKQLASVKFPSIQVMQTLRQIQQKINFHYTSLHQPDQSSINLIQLLIAFTCQNKNSLHLEHFQHQHLSQKCLAHIQQIFLLLIKNSHALKLTIINHLTQHLLLHPSCFVAYLLLYKLNKRLNSELIPLLTYEFIKKINIKIIAHFQQVANQISTLHSLSKNTPLKNCEQNLTHFLKTQSTPSNSSKNPQQKIRPSKTKIPPLLLPTAKSIGSSRYSYSNGQTTKKKGISDLVKLAQSLGEGFVSVELGILIGNKRTQQVNEFTQNSCT